MHVNESCIVNPWANTPKISRTYMSQNKRRVKILRSHQITFCQAIYSRNTCAYMSIKFQLLLDG